MRDVIVLLGAGCIPFNLFAGCRFKTLFQGVPFITILTKNLVHFFGKQTEQFFSRKPF